MFEKATRGMSIYAKIAYCFLVAMGVCIPFAAGSEYYPIPVTVSQFTLFKMCAFFVLVGGAAFFFALDLIMGEREVRWHPIIWFALGYAAINVLSYAFALDKRVSLFGEYDRFLGLVPTLLTVLLLFLTLQLMRNNASMRLFMQVFVITSVFLAAYGLAQAGGIETAHFANMETLGRRSFSLFGNPNLYAGYLCFAVFFSAGLLVTEKNIMWKSIFWVALIANGAVALTSMTRSVWLACVVIGPLFVIFMIRQKVVLTTIDKSVMGISSVGIVGFVLISLKRKTADLNVGTRIASMFSDNASSATRIETWKTALKVIKEYPLLGSGPDSFGVSGASKITYKYLSIMGMDSTSNNAHCMPLQLAATIGIVGMLSYYVVLVYGCMISFRYAWDNSETKQRNARIFYASVLCALLAYSVNALVSVAPIEALPFYWLCLGFLCAPKVRAIKLDVPAVALGSLVFASAIFIGSFVFVFCFVGADHSYRLAKDMKQGSQEQVEAYKKATKLNPFESDYETEYADSLGGNYISRLSTLSQNDVRIFLTALDDSYAKYPNSIDMQAVASYYHTAMAVIYQTSDFINEALQVNDEILRKSRYDITTMANQGALYRIIGKEQQAQLLRNKIISLGANSKKEKEALAFIDSSKSKTTR